MNTIKFKPTNTIISVDSILNIKPLIDAKSFLTENYGNYYSFIPPHLGYALVPFSEKHFEEAREEILDYIHSQKPFKITFPELLFEEEKAFFSLLFKEEKIVDHHKSILKMLSKYRDMEVRPKDCDKYDKGLLDDLEVEYLAKYGYYRVMDRYNPHITVGNVTERIEDIEKIKSSLNKILGEIIGKEIVIDNMHAVFYEDKNVGNQSGLKPIWEETFTLN